MRFMREQATRIQHRNVLMPTGWAGSELRNCLVDARAQVAGPVRVGGDRVITLIGTDGHVAHSVEMDPAEPLPRGI